MARSPWLWLVGFLLGCASGGGSPRTPVDAGPPRDAGASTDAALDAPTPSETDGGSCVGLCDGFTVCRGTRCEPLPSCDAGCAPTEVCRNDVCVPRARDVDGDGVQADTDCDESNPEVYPGATEVCDAVDQDCDARVDEGVGTTFYRDADGDGAGDDTTTTTACTAPEGYVASAGDCDDDRADARPGGVERCSGVDDDCDTLVDEAACPSGCRGTLSNGRAYATCTGTRSWSASRTLCQTAGMDLSAIDSMAENDAVRALATAAGLGNTWVGGTDSATEDRWLWTDGRHFWQGRSGGSAQGGLFARWASGEPNDDGTEDCAVMRSDGTWNDTECGNGNATVCEAP
ncbi:MAG: hypothetical protein KC586_00390 [Myxococcales bacterium]|nr:hypothetical protein [Myxococcales bacterium]